MADSLDPGFSQDQLQPLFRRLEQHDVLGDDERQALAASVLAQRAFTTRTDMVREGSRSNRSTTDHRLTQPFTQAGLADTLGLSTVHINRTLQQLRSMDVLSWQNSAVTIRDLERLNGIAEFNPQYLHLHREPR